MEIIRIARKIHICDTCDKPAIKKNDLYFYYSTRTPKYNEFDRQVGIEYITFKICESCNDEAKEDAQNAKMHEDEFDY